MKPPDVQDQDGHSYVADLVALAEDPLLDLVVLDNGSVSQKPAPDSRRVETKLALLRQLRNDLERERKRAELTESTRDEAARSALDAGATVAQAAEAAGVSVPRMYQIRDRRR